MLYLDDDTRRDFANANVLLQVVCSILDTYLFAYGVQPEIIDAETNRAHIGLADCSDIICAVVFEKINQQFARHDHRSTLKWVDQENHIVVLEVSKPSDFVYLL